MGAGPLLPWHATVVEGLQPLVNTRQMLADVAAEGSVGQLIRVVMVQGHANDARVGTHFV